MENKYEPAFPITEDQMDRIDHYPNMVKMAGISKRLYIATAAMQAIITTTSFPLGRHTLKGIARLSIAMADAIIEEDSTPE